VAATLSLRSAFPQCVIEFLQKREASLGRCLRGPESKAVFRIEFGEACRGELLHKFVETDAAMLRQLSQAGGSVVWDANRERRHGRLLGGFRNSAGVMMPILGK
jgi:hypothetical protein